ncbi:hypothetical protein Dpoa569_0002005 [Dickeya poaceiphila]|uniref:Uncharacterized protein n=1 Tax=Dickeya poaceiphila TaxID=568768 RepID=A0A5B8I6M6_9GAMM|nr:hypothetical protein Dpoa569_0002005 [Dickeya poaceiphila]
MTGLCVCLYEFVSRIGGWIEDNHPDQRWRRAVLYIIVGMSRCVAADRQGFLGLTIIFRGGM